MKRVSVKVPASTANLGPGFDSFSLALGIYNELHLEISDQGHQLDIQGEGAESLPKNRSNLIFQAIELGCRALGVEAPNLCLLSINHIPLGSGLGSSAAAAVAGLVAINALFGDHLGEQELLRLAIELEGHADNAAASLFGGLNIVNSQDESILLRKVPVVPLDVVIALPDVALSTIEMRRVLPSQIPLSDAAYNVANAALCIQALREGDYELLTACMQDRLHQPYRKTRIPAYDLVVNAAHQAGAAAVVLSGAGPSLIAFAPAQHGEIGAAMQQEFQRAGVAARIFVLPVDQDGVQIELQGEGGGGVPG
jgi:homoserine kinase